MKYNTFSSPIKGLSRGVGHEVLAVLDRLLEAPFVWAERTAERRHLAELDDHLLNDIGPVSYTHLTLPTICSV